MFSKQIIIFLIFLWLLYGCKSTHPNKQLQQHTQNFIKQLPKNQFTGILVYNPKTKDTLISYNADKYFTPASNTKIFTLFAGLKMLTPEISAYKYAIEKDTLIIQGTGDPTFLHPFFKDSTLLKHAKKFKKVKIQYSNLSDTMFGPGWAWEDFDTYFSPERTSLPMYGNIITITNKEKLQCIPKVLEKNIQRSHTKFARDAFKNNFYYKPKTTKTIEIPMVMDSLLYIKLWNHLLPNKVSLVNKNLIKQYKTAVSNIPTDSLYKRMLFQSDNFLAEQILILCASTLSDTLDTNKLRKYVLGKYLNDLQQTPRWIDGSGLSRYNLCTPKSLVHVLQKLYIELPKKRLYSLFPLGGKSGTIKNWYAGNPRPYIYAKSGSLSNNYSLSGYLITNSGETLIFSFMNNHFRKSNKEIKRQMQSFFEWLRDTY